MAFRLNHIHVKTPDPEKTAQFPVDNLGAKIVGQVGPNGLRMDLHGLSINVTKDIEGQTREQVYGMEHIAIDTDDLEATRQGVSAYQKHALVPHDAYQALYASGEAEKIFSGFTVHVISGNQVISEV